MDLISVVVPIFNASQYLDVCINSILQQDYANLEIILINDGSTDDSLKICEEFKFDNRVKIIDKKNEGLSIARQLGFELSKGKYVCTIDSDDWIEHDYIQSLHKSIIEKDSDICVCSSKHYYSNGKVIENEIDFSQMYLSIEPIDIENNYFELVNKLHFSDSWNKMYKLQFVKETNVRFTLDKELIGTDLLFNSLLLLFKPKISITKKFLYNYRILSNSKTRKKNKNLLKGFNIITSELINYAESLNYSNKVIEQFYILYLNFIYMIAVDFYSEIDSISDRKTKILKLFDDSHQFFNEKIKSRAKMANIKNKTLIIINILLFRKNAIYFFWFLEMKNLVRRR